MGGQRGTVRVKCLPKNTTQCPWLGFEHGLHDPSQVYMYKLCDLPRGCCFTSRDGIHVHVKSLSIVYLTIIPRAHVGYEVIDSP